MQSPGEGCQGGITSQQLTQVWHAHLTLLQRCAFMAEAELHDPIGGKGNLGWRRWWCCCWEVRKVMLSAQCCPLKV